MSMHRNRNGVALLMVVLVLAMLTIIGVLFSLTVSVHLKTNIQYREWAEVENGAQMALHRVMSEMMYNVWGANEMRAFTCADGTPLGTPLGTAVGPYSYGTYAGDPNDEDNPPTAYYKSATDPSGVADKEPLLRPWSTYARSVVSLDYYDAGQPGGADYKGNENDYRWMVSASVWGGEFGNGVIAERLIDARKNDDGTPRAVPSGAMYHDEFLPTGLSNNDLFEMALHYNHGTIFGRTRIYSYNIGADYQRDAGNQIGGYNALLAKDDTFVSTDGSNDDFWGWRVNKGKMNAGRNSPNLAHDPIDTRIVGDSFYRIFRFDLVDPLDFKVRGTGVDPDKPGRYYSDTEIFSREKPAMENGARIIRATHLGDATGDTVSGSHVYYAHGSDTSSKYTDPLGKAINLNSVNLNYSFELYEDAKFGSLMASGWDLGWNKLKVMGAKAWQVDKFHYNESKWIYLYESENPESGPNARYALMVWPDCGLPSANFITSKASAWNAGDLPFTDTHRANAWLSALDVGVGESGCLPLSTNGDTGRDIQTGKITWTTVQGESGIILGNLAVMKIKTLPDSPVKWNSTAKDYNRESGAGIGMSGRMATWLDVHRRNLGSFGSRAELEIFLRKNVFTDLDVDLESDRNTACDATNKQRTIRGELLQDLTATELRLGDSQLIANYYSTNGYTYLLDPHWEQDRLVLDGAGMDNRDLSANKDNKLHRHATSKRDDRGFSAWESGNNTRALTQKILGNIKEYYGPYALQKPAAPCPAFIGDYGKISDKLFASHQYVGPNQSKKAAAMTLSTLLQSTYCYKDNERQSFAINEDDVSDRLLPNPRPEDVLFGNTRWRLENVSALRITEVGSGIFTVPMGPKYLDPDFIVNVPNTAANTCDWLFPTLLNYAYLEDTAQIPQSPMLGGGQCNRNQMDPTKSGYLHQYNFETKSMNYIELFNPYDDNGHDSKATVGESQTLAGSFLRVYGNVLNWEGKCIDDEGNVVNRELGGRGYVDLFARVKRRPTYDVNSDGKIDAADAERKDVNVDGKFTFNELPKFTVDTRTVGDDGKVCVTKGWADGVYYDPDHYIEGVVIRYAGAPGRGKLDHTDSDKDAGDGFFKDTNGDGNVTNDRDWRTEYDSNFAGKLYKVIANKDVFMQPHIKIGESTADVLFEDGKYYDIRNGATKNLLNPYGIVGDNIPDEDWGTPDQDGKTTTRPGQGVQDQKIDGVFESFMWKNVGSTANHGRNFYEDLADWMTNEKCANYVKALDGSLVKDLFSARSFGNIVVKSSTKSNGRPILAGGPSGNGGVTYRFGSYIPFDIGSNTWNATSDPSTSAGVDYGWRNHYVTEVGDPYWGADNQWGVGQYLLVLFPHQRTPWTRRNPDAPNEPPEGHLNGYGHYDDKAKYHGDGKGDGLLPVGEERTSNYADGDMIVWGRFEDDYYRGEGPHLRNIPQQDKNYPEGWRKSPRVYNFVKLNGKHPDFSSVGGAAGGECRFERKGATISGGDSRLGGCAETLPFGKNQTLTSFPGNGVHYGFAARDPRDNSDPWCWDAVVWDWGQDQPVPMVLDQPVTSKQQSPVFTAFDSRQIYWSPRNWVWISDVNKPNITDPLGRGRFDFHVDGSNSNGINRQLDQGDPALTPGRSSNNGMDLTLPSEFLQWIGGTGPWRIDAQTKDAEVGRYPFVISTSKNTRASQSKVFTELLNYRMTFAQRGNFFWDRIWMHMICLGTQDLRLRSWWDLCFTTRADEYFESGCQNPAQPFAASSNNPIKDDHDINMTGAQEDYTDKPLWGKRWVQGKFETNSDLGRYSSERKIIKRININEICSPVSIYALGLGGTLDSGIYFSNVLKNEYITSGNYRISPITLLGHKPFRGYPYVFGWHRSASRFTANRLHSIWNDNLWASAQVDLITRGELGTGEEGWAGKATVSPSPVYTVFIVAQRLDASGQPLCEEKLRVTVERTWDGKMNVLDYRMSSED